MLLDKYFPIVYNQKQNEVFMANEKMITVSIYIRESISERLKMASGRHSVSTILDELAEVWLNGEVEITIEPQKEKE